mmetsp:Transcript_23846/g.34704  ORF Transcript_23846/g.34704 Transcript_23846/m.34704 type:complete len:627 (+) Transcript_23846:174-2054(+)
MSEETSNKMTNSSLLLSKVTEEKDDLTSSLPSKSLLMSSSPSKKEEEKMNPLAMIAILSTAFAYGLIVTTTFLVILPLECARIEIDHITTTNDTSSSLFYSKSISLAFFVSLAGLTQLVSPIFGLLSDHMVIPPSYPTYLQILGKRLPYLLLGTAMTVIGILCQMYTSFYNLWIRYIFSFTSNIIGLTILYSVMIALIPDLIPTKQIGTANGTWAFLLVCGSLFGFGAFYLVMEERIHDMYVLYVAVMLISTIVTVFFVVRHTEHIKRTKCEMTDTIKKSSNKEEEEVENSAELGDFKKETSPLLPPSTNSSSNAIGYTFPNETTKEQKSNNIDKQQTKKEHVSLFDILRLLLYIPIQNMSSSEIRAAYTINPATHHDFLIVTISRTFYYMAISNQSFFLYFVHDVIRQHSHPEAAVSKLAIVGQMAGAITCYPVGVFSDYCCHGRRRPFVYFACVILALGNIALLFCRDMKQMIIVCGVLGGANGIYLTMDTSLAVDTLDLEGNEDKVKTDGKVDESEHEIEGGEVFDDKKENNSGAAQLLGVWGVADFIGSALGPLVGGPLLYIFGTVPPGSNSVIGGSYDGGEESEDGGNWYTFQGYEAIMIMSAIYSLSSAISLLFLRKKGI